jgi:predicted permease
MHEPSHQENRSPIEDDSTVRSSGVAKLGLSLVLAIALASMLTLFGFGLLDSITEYEFGPTGLLILATLLVIQNFGMMILVGWMISRRNG